MRRFLRGNSQDPGKSGPWAPATVSVQRAKRGASWPTLFSRVNARDG
jgi:hypothetical protein